MSKKSHHFLTLWPWPLTYDLEKLIRSGHYHYQCVYQIWEQSIQWFLSYRVNTIAGGGRLRHKTITSPDPSDTGEIIISINCQPFCSGFNGLIVQKFCHKKLRALHCIWPLQLASLYTSTVYPIKHVHGFVVFCFALFILQLLDDPCDLLISFRVISHALGQSYDCPSVSDITLKDMGKIIGN